MWIVAIRPEHAMAHARVTCKINHRNFLQAERPRYQQMKSAVPRKIVNASGCFEKNNRRAIWLRLFAEHFARQRCDLEIVEPAHKSAFDALGEELFHAVLTNHYFSHN